MRSAKRTTWAVLSGVLGLGLLAVLGTLAFYFFAKQNPVNPGAAVSELMNKVEPGDVVVAIGSEPPHFGQGATPAPAAVKANTPLREAAQDEQPPAVRALDADERARLSNPGVIVLAALPTPTAPGTTTTGPTEATVAAVETAPLASAATLATDSSEATDAPEPPPGSRYGVTYCGAVTCGVGLKCCCQSCVPFDQACDPRSCAAQSGLSISVPCGMDLCDPGEICCDTRCGECARAGECPAEPCK